MAKGRHNYRTHHGSKHGMSIFTEEIVLEIRRLYAAEEMTQVALGQRYNTTQTNISNIVSRKSWRHI